MRDDGSGTAALLRDLVYDEQGRLRPGRLSALLQAALGYVSEQTEGFVDFDSVPAEGASVGEVLAFVLGPEARELRPLLVGWLAGTADLVVRDRARKAAAALPGLVTPRLPFAALLGLPSLPSPPPPPVFIPGESAVQYLVPRGCGCLILSSHRLVHWAKSAPCLLRLGKSSMCRSACSHNMSRTAACVLSCAPPGKGIMSLPDAVDLVAPPLTDQEVIYYQSLLELAAGKYQSQITSHQHMLAVWTACVHV